MKQESTSAYQLIPTELWIDIARLTAPTTVAKSLPSSTRLLADILASHSHLHLRRSIVLDLLSAVYGPRADVRERCRHSLCAHLFPDFVLRENYSYYDPYDPYHPLQMLLRITSCQSASIQNHPFIVRASDFLVQPQTLRAVLDPRHVCTTSSLQDDPGQSQPSPSLPDVLDQALRNWHSSTSTSSLANPVVLACIYATHFVSLGDTCKLNLTLDLLTSCLAAYPQNPLTSPDHAAHPKVWSLAVLRQLHICSTTQRPRLDLSRHRELLGWGHVTDLRLTFAEYLVWLALHNWRMDVMQAIADRFSVNAADVMRRVLARDTYRSVASAIESRLGLMADEQDADAVMRRVVPQLEWMTGLGWPFRQWDSTVAGNRIAVGANAILEHLPVTKVCYPAFVKVMHDYEQLELNEENIQRVFRGGIWGLWERVMEYVELDPSFVDVVPLVLDHLALVDSEDQQVDLLLALLFAKHIHLAEDLIRQCRDLDMQGEEGIMKEWSWPHVVLWHAFTRVLGYQPNINLSEFVYVLESIVTLDLSLADSPINWTQALTAPSWPIPVAAMHHLLFHSPALSGAFDYRSLFHHILQQPIRATDRLDDDACKPYLDQLDLICRLFQHLESSPLANPLWADLDTPGSHMDPLLVLIAHILHLASTCAHAESTWTANPTLIRMTTTNLVTRYFSCAPADSSVPPLSSLHPQIIHSLTTRVARPSLVLFPNARELPLARDEWPDVLFAFDALVRAGIASWLVPWNRQVPEWVWAVVEQTETKKQAGNTDEAVAKASGLKSSEEGVDCVTDREALAVELQRIAGDNQSDPGVERGQRNGLMWVMAVVCVLVATWWTSLRAGFVRDREA